MLESTGELHKREWVGLRIATFDVEHRGRCPVNERYRLNQPTHVQDAIVRTGPAPEDRGSKRLSGPWRRNDPKMPTALKRMNPDQVFDVYSEWLVKRAAAQAGGGTTTTTTTTSSTTTTTTTAAAGAAGAAAAIELSDDE